MVVKFSKTGANTNKKIQLKTTPLSIKQTLCKEYSELQINRLI